MSQDDFKKRTITVPVADDIEMCRLATEYGCPLTEVYRRATALYILTQSRAAMFDVWPGANPDDEPLTWSGEGV